MMLNTSHIWNKLSQALFFFCSCKTPSLKFLFHMFLTGPSCTDLGRSGHWASRPRFRMLEAEPRKVRTSQRPALAAPGSSLSPQPCKASLLTTPAFSSPGTIYWPEGEPVIFKKRKQRMGSSHRNIEASDCRKHRVLKGSEKLWNMYILSTTTVKDKGNWSFTKERKGSDELSCLQCQASRLTRQWHDIAEQRNKTQHSTWGEQGTRIRGEGGEGHSGEQSGKELGQSVWERK